MTIYRLISKSICIGIPPNWTKANIVTTSLDTQEIHLMWTVTHMGEWAFLPFCLRSIPPWLSSIGWAWDTGQAEAQQLGMLTSYILLLLSTKAPSNRCFEQVECLPCFCCAQGLMHLHSRQGSCMWRGSACVCHDGHLNGLRKDICLFIYFYCCCLVSGRL